MKYTKNFILFLILINICLVGCDTVEDIKQTKETAYETKETVEELKKIIKDQGEQINNLKKNPAVKVADNAAFQAGKIKNGKWSYILTIFLIILFAVGIIKIYFRYKRWNNGNKISQ